VARRLADSGGTELGKGNAIAIADAMLRGSLPVDPTDRPVGFVASEGRRKFHLPNCKWASSFVNSSRCLRFGSKKDAVKAGYKPCRLCSP
jgi:hypothetical protein